jgi:inner membrane transporter RhtA
MNSRGAQPIFMIVGSCVSLQFGAAIAVPLMAQFGSGMTTALRLFFASALLLLAYRPCPWRWNREQWVAVVLFGVSLAGMNSFFYAAIARIPLGIAVTIEFVGPLLLAALLSRRFRDLMAVIAAAAAIAILGVEGSVSQATDLDLRGVVYALCAAAFWAFYILAGKHLSSRISGHGALPIGMLVGAVLVIPFTAGALPELTRHMHLLIPVIAVAIFSSFIPYSLEFAAMRRLNSRTFGVLLSLEPAIASLIGWILLHQSITPLQGLAIAVVITASITATLGQSDQSALESASRSSCSACPGSQCNVGDDPPVTTDGPTSVGATHGQLTTGTCQR